METIQNQMSPVNGRTFSRNNIDISNDNQTTLVGIEHLNVSQFQEAACL